jgi:serine/threonine protein kinase
VNGLQVPESLARGRYRLGHMLGEGGMAQVYRVHDVELGVDRAVKVLHAGRTSVRRRLRNEAKAMAQLRHPHILGIHDVGQEGDLDYIVMDLATHGSLQDRVARDGPMPMGDAIAATVKVLSALATAHAAGIVHRDVKPHNVLLDEHDQPLLADFGIAMLVEADRSTKTGVAMGSLAFMPPEQRLDAAHVGPTADIYAAGCTLFALLTNDNPVDLFLASADSDRWAGVPELLRAVVQTACAPHPSDRYPTAKDMADALLAVLDHLGPEEKERALNSRGFFPAPSKALASRSMAPPASVHTPAPSPRTSQSSAADTLAPPSTPAPQPTSARRWPVLAVALAALVFLCSGGAWWAFAPQPPTVADTPPVPGPAPASQPMERPPSPRPDEEQGVTPPAAPAAVEPAPAMPAEPEPGPQPPSAQPAPAPTAPEPSPGRADASAVGGSWVGSANGRQVRLELQGEAEALRGSFDTTWAGRTDRSPVVGRFDAETGRLALEDVDDGLDKGRYELTLKDGRMKGFFVRSAGGRVPLQMYRP